jgi:hypothetical protein
METEPVVEGQVPTVRLWWKVGLLRPELMV